MRSLSNNTEAGTNWGVSTGGPSCRSVHARDSQESIGSQPKRVQQLWIKTQKSVKYCSAEPMRQLRIRVRILN